MEKPKLSIMMVPRVVVTQWKDVKMLFIHILYFTTFYPVLVNKLFLLLIKIVTLLCDLQSMLFLFTVIPCSVKSATLYYYNYIFKIMFSIFNIKKKSNIISTVNKINTNNESSVAVEAKTTASGTSEISNSITDIDDLGNLNSGPVQPRIKVFKYNLE